MFQIELFVVQPDGVVTFTWTAQQQAYVLSGYFWGYSISCLVGGTAAEFWGPRKLVFVTMLISGILTMLSPQAARWHYMVLVAVRFVSGLAAVRYSFAFSCFVRKKLTKKYTLLKMTFFVMFLFVFTCRYH